MSDGWQRQAACRELSAEDADRIFFPVGTHGPKGRGPDYTEALSFCDRCPVRAECLAMAMDAERSTSVHSRFGMFGGLTPQERAARNRGDVLLDGERRCVWCDVPFMPRRTNNISCNRECGNSYQAKQARKRMAAQRAERGAA